MGRIAEERHPAEGPCGHGVAVAIGIFIEGAGRFDDFRRLDEADPQCARGFDANILWSTRDTSVYAEVLAVLAALGRDAATTARCFFSR